MVIYDLICDLEHRFEGWFKSEQEYLDQQTKGLLCCPACESKTVRKLPSASYVSTRKQTISNQTNGPGTNASQQILKMLNQYIIANTEDVGERFVAEVKKMHYGEIDERNIRGHASKDEVEALHDEGINVIALPANHLEKKKLN